MTTASLSSSLDVLSLNSSTTTWASDSLSDEDEIVWSLSSSALLSTSPPLQSPLSETGDFVLVPRATAAAAAAALSASPTADTIADEMAALSLTPAVRAHGSAADPAASTAPKRASPIKRATKSKKRHQTVAAIEHQQQQRQPAPPAGPRKKGKKAKRARGSSASSSVSSTAAAGEAPVAPSSSSSSSSDVRSAAGKKSPAKKKKSAGGSATGLGLGTRAVVDDSVSETSEASSSSSAAASSATTAATDGYQEAHKYMTSYLAHPPPSGNNNNGSALLMLQALILELGCLPSVAAGKFSIPQLPTTLRQAKLLLKSHAFINVRDYLAVREQGQDALQRVMHPSRTSLVKEVRKKAKRMPVGEVKKAGLNVLLVHTHS